jgi:hypothetical protein
MNKPPVPNTIQRDVLFLTLGTVACLLPFIGKAVHLDDPVYVWIAQQIHINPADFFGFQINWQGALVTVSEFNRNPPGVSYVLALAAALGGWSETALHLGILPCSIAVVLGTYAFACRCCSAPLLATVAGCATPAFMVSATTLMADIPMLACWVWALVFWERGMRSNHQGNFFVAATLVALGALTKFIAVTLIPLLLAWSIVRDLRLRLYLLWLLLPIGALIGFDLYTAHVYEHGILSDAADYAAGIGTKIPRHERFITAVIFVGGTLITVALFTPWLVRGRARIASAFAIPAMLGLIVALGQLGYTPIHLLEGGVRWDIALHACIFAAAGLPVLFLSVDELRRPRGDTFGWLLAAWLLGIFVFAAAVNWTVSTRVILPMVPAAGILLVRGLERAGTLNTAWRVAPLVAGLATSILVAHADYQWAGSTRDAAIDLADRYWTDANSDARADIPNTTRTKLQFQGHWGFQYYMEQMGASAFDLRKRRVIPGSILINPCNNTNVVPFPQSFGHFVETVRYPTSRYVTVHSPTRGVGFYASTFGPLPFALGPAPDDPYDVLRLQAPTGAPAEDIKRNCGMTPSG